MRSSDRNPQAHGRAQVACDGATQEAPVLDRQRVVEAELLAQLLLPLGRDRSAFGTRQHELDRVARERVHDREDDRARPATSTTPSWAIRRPT